MSTINTMSEATFQYVRANGLDGGAQAAAGVEDLKLKDGALPPADGTPVAGRVSMPRARQDGLSGDAPGLPGDLLDSLDLDLTTLIAMVQSLMLRQAQDQRRAATESSFAELKLYMAQAETQLLKDKEAANQKFTADIVQAVASMAASVIQLGMEAPSAAALFKSKSNLSKSQKAMRELEPEQAQARRGLAEAESDLDVAKFNHERSHRRLENKQQDLSRNKARLRELEDGGATPRQIDAAREESSLARKKVDQAEHEVMKDEQAHDLAVERRQAAQQELDAIDAQVHKIEKVREKIRTDTEYYGAVSRFGSACGQATNGIFGIFVAMANRDSAITSAEARYEGTLGEYHHTLFQQMQDMAGQARDMIRELMSSLGTEAQAVQTLGSTVWRNI